MIESPVLDQLSHRYHIQGKPLDSVTKIIKNVWPNKPTFDQAPAHVLDHARHRGQRVDYWTGEYAATNGNIDIEDDDDVVESVELFDKWWQKYRPVYIEHQRMVWSEHLSVCGTLDLFLVIDGEPAIIDVKRTYNEEETWQIQVGGYLDLYNHMPVGDQFNVKNASVLHIHPRFKNGYIWRKYDTAQAVEAWRATLAFYRAVEKITK